MATTTNYAWETPDDTDLVKDGAAAIRTLGSSVDTTTKALNPSTTLGDIEYRSSTANTNTRLGIGSTGQVLTVAGGVPSWATPAAGGGGKVLQVVQGTTTTSTSSSSNTFADTGLTATITPSSASSKVLVMYSMSYRKTAGAADNAVNLRLLRGATNIGARTSMGYTSTAILNYGTAGSIVLDTPATTSATTYKVEFASDNNTAAVTVQGSNDLSTIILMEIGA